MTKNTAIVAALVLVVLLALLFTVGCAGNHAYRQVYDLNNPALPNPDVKISNIEVTNAYKLGIVEFDDQGWFWDYRQKQGVEMLISNECGLGSDHPSGVIVVMFVHGWKNNAAYDNGNVETFRTVLTQLNDLEIASSQQKGTTPRKIIGVYGGWRGLSLKSDYFPPLGMETTIWSRKNAAQRVGSYGAMTELLVDLESLEKLNNQALPTNAPPSKLIIVGHSLGADAVYHGLSQILAERFVQTMKYQKGQILKPLGDQVIFLNPAFQAARFYDLEQLARSVSDYSTNQRPILTVLQSEGDWATQSFFPIGQKVVTVFQRYSASLQRDADHESVGWFKPFISHQLKYAPESVGTVAADASPAVPHTLRTRDHLPALVENIRAARQQWAASRAENQSIPFGRCVLTPVQHYPPRNPILVVSVDKAIMKDHDDIGNPTLINFLQAYIPFCDDEPAATK